MRRNIADLSQNGLSQGGYGPGAVQKDLELAHGTKVGYVKDGDLTFLGEIVADEQAKTPSILSLGRLIQNGAKMQWTKEGAVLTLPSGKGLKSK